MKKVHQKLKPELIDVKRGSQVTVLIQILYLLKSQEFFEFWVK